MLSLDLREKLFEQLSTSEVKYGNVDCFDTLMELVKSLERN